MVRNGEELSEIVRKPMETIYSSTAHQKAYVNSLYRFNFSSNHIVK